MLFRSWNFTWQEFIKSIDFEYDMLQLCVIAWQESDSIAKWSKTQYSNTAYLVTRKFARKAINELFIDNQDRTSYALQQSNSLIYGTFNATPSSQTLRTNSQFTATYGVSVSTAGYGLTVKSGSNAKIGTATFTAQNTVTVNTTAVTANSLIFVTGQDGTDAFAVGNKIAGTSFDIVHSSGNVTATVAWMIVEATP